jgi:hypothetical protein
MRYTNIRINKYISFIEGCLLSAGCKMDCHDLPRINHSTAGDKQFPFKIKDGEIEVHVNI